MGTDSDLRKLKLSKAKTLLRNFGVAEEEVGVLILVRHYVLLFVDWENVSLASCGQSERALN